MIWTRIWRRLALFPWMFFFLCALLCLIGVGLLYDAAGGNWQPFAVQHAARAAVGLGLFAVLALTDIRLVYKAAYPAYFTILALLAVVEIMGSTGMGAQRWLKLGPIVIQPSEMMKVALVLVLARFYHGRTGGSVHTLPALFWPALLIALPVLLIVRQPDLGTAAVVAMLGVMMMFAGGVTWKLFAGGIAAICVSAPILWTTLHGYQKKRILTFFNPEHDPLGAGYHVMQSKIAIGSAGFWGKGFLQGTQAHLSFLPEMHTDFIFTLLSEEFGLVGALSLMLLYLFYILIGTWYARRAQSDFASIAAFGLVGLVFVHATINMAMVMGLLPVVGVPLPFISYGGSALLSALIASGLIAGTHVHRDIIMPGYKGLSPMRRF